MYVDESTLFTSSHTLVELRENLILDLQNVISWVRMNKNRKHLQKLHVAENRAARYRELYVKNCSL